MGSRYSWQPRSADKVSVLVEVYGAVNVPPQPTSLTEEFGGVLFTIPELYCMILSDQLTLSPEAGTGNALLRVDKSGEVSAEAWMASGYATR